MSEYTRIRYPTERLVKLDVLDDYAEPRELTEDEKEKVRYWYDRFLEHSMREVS